MKHNATFLLPFFVMVLTAAQVSSSLDELIREKMIVVQGEIADLAFVEGKAHAARDEEDPPATRDALVRRRGEIEGSIERMRESYARLERARDGRAVRIGDPVILGTVVPVDESRDAEGLPPSQAELLREHMDASAVLPRLNACYAQELLRNPSFFGSVVVKVVIAPGGEATTSVKSTTMHHPMVESCVLDVVATMRYAEREDMAMFSLPIKFF